MTDRDSIGRRVHRRGAHGIDNGRAVLTWELVRWIRKSPASVRWFARRLGCGRSTVQNVRSGLTWRER